MATDKALMSPTTRAMGRAHPAFSEFLAMRCGIWPGTMHVIGPVRKAVDCVMFTRLLPVSS